MRVWIHGAFASPTSFNYMRTQIQDDSDLMIRYECDGDIIHTINRIKSFIEKKADEPVDFIGHSLGGVLALILYHLDIPTRSINTLCAPYGGLENSVLFRWMFPRSIYSEFVRIQDTYRHLIAKEITVPHQIFVATIGSNPFFLGKPNDGVVSVASQKALKTSNVIEVDTNHYEILMNSDVTHKINLFYKEIRRGK